MPEESIGPAQRATAFLLSQLGTQAAIRFAEQIGELDLTPPQVGILAMIDGRPGLSQQALAEELGLLPSKIVSFIDDFETRELVTRSRSTSDRRVYELRLTDRGSNLLARAKAAGDEHETVFFAALSSSEYQTLRELLRRLADDHGLTARPHPGYRHLS